MKGQESFVSWFAVEFGRYRKQLSGDSGSATWQRKRNPFSSFNLEKFEAKPVHGHSLASATSVAGSALNILQVTVAYSSLFGNGVKVPWTRCSRASRLT